MYRITVLVAAGLLLTGIALGQNPPTISVDVPLMMIDVQVSDAAGRPVKNLTREDFRIFEDGNPKAITVFEPVESPYSIQLLLDRSTSMQDYWPLLVPALTRFIAGLKPNDRVSIGAFDERSQDVQLLLDWREARNGQDLAIRIDPAVRGVRIPLSVSNSELGPKDFDRAVEWAARRLQITRGRKGAIVFGDGWGYSSALSGKGTSMSFDGRSLLRLRDGQDDGDFKRVQRAVVESQARFDFIALNTDLNLLDRWISAGAGEDNVLVPNPLIFGISVRARLEQLAAISGGRVAFPRRAEELAVLYEAIARELGTSYTLGYSPSEPLREDIPHRIEVRSRPELKIEQSRETFR